MRLSVDVDGDVDENSSTAIQSRKLSECQLLSSGRTDNLFLRDGPGQVRNHNLDLLQDVHQCLQAGKLAGESRRGALAVRGRALLGGCRQAQIHASHAVLDATLRDDVRTLALHCKRGMGKGRRILLRSVMTFGNFEPTAVDTPTLASHHLGVCKSSCMTEWYVDRMN